MDPAVRRDESGKPTQPVVQVDFRPINRRHADELFTALPKEAKWAEVATALLMGEAVFVPYMTRNQLESLRTIVNRRGYGRLRSRDTEVDGIAGRVLRLQKNIPGKKDK